MEIVKIAKMYLVNYCSLPIIKLSACAGLQPVHAWFLKVVSVWTYVSGHMYVSVCAPEAINN